MTANSTRLGVVVQIGFLLSLDFQDRIHVVFMRQFCTVPSQRDHALCTNDKQPLVFQSAKIIIVSRHRQSSLVLLI